MRPVLQARTFDPPDAESERDVIEYGSPEEEWVLGDETDSAAEGEALWRTRRRLPSPVTHDAALGLQEEVDAPEKRRLPHTAGTHEPARLPRRPVQADSPEPPALVEALPQAIDIQGHRHGSVRSWSR